MLKAFENEVIQQDLTTSQILQRLNEAEYFKAISRSLMWENYNLILKKEFEEDYMFWLGEEIKYAKIYKYRLTFHKSVI